MNFKLDVMGIVRGGEYDGQSIFISPSPTQEDVYFIFRGKFDENGNVPFYGDDICFGIGEIQIGLKVMNFDFIEWSE